MNQTHRPLATTDRRGFLAATLAAASSGWMAPAAKAASPGYIDAHVHVWTPDTERYPLGEGFAKKDMEPASFTPEELFAHCKPQGVDRVVLIQMSYYKYDNRYMLDMMAKHQGVFSGVAILDHEAADASATLKTLAQKGVRGLRLYANSKADVEGWQDSPTMKALWTQAADEGVAMCLLANPDALPAALVMSQKFPKTRVVIDHFARIGMKGPVQEADLENLRRFADLSQAYVKTSAFYALGEKKAPYQDIAPLIRTLRSTFGASRLMWASDCPFQVVDGHTYADSIGLVRDRLDFLTPEDKDWMLRGTAAKVFF